MYIPLELKWRIRVLRGDLSLIEQCQTSPFWATVVLLHIYFPLITLPNHKLLKFLFYPFLYTQITSIAIIFSSFSFSHFLLPTLPFDKKLTESKLPHNIIKIIVFIIHKLSIMFQYLCYECTL